jgi:3-dehydrosphinganine reductase
MYKKTFSGKNIIITGGSSGVGAGLAEILYETGANIALIARDREKLARVCKNIIASGGGHRNGLAAYSCDVTDYAATVDTIDRIAEETGAPDYLFNSAGILSSDYFENLQVENFHAVMETNFFGSLHAIKAAIPYFKKKKAGHIVNISSLSGMFGVFGYSSYCASKFALVGLSESLRSELKPQGIKIHLVLPPEINTPMIDGIRDTRPIENEKLTHSAGVLSQQETVSAIIAGVARGRFIIVPGKKARMMALTNRLMPGTTRYFVDMIIRKNYRGPNEVIK